MMERNGDGGARERIRERASAAPAWPAHEHIGSLTSFGSIPGPWFPSDVTPALRPGRTTLLELLFTPYSAPQLFAMGATYPTPDVFADAEKRLAALRALRPALSAAGGLGVFVAMDRGLKTLYGTGLEEALDDPDPSRLRDLDRAVTERYADYFAWYAQVFARCGAVRALKPVHPDYLVAMEGGAGAEELAYATPIARVESLVGFLDDSLVLDFTGVERCAGFPVDGPDALDRMVDWFFALCDRRGIRSIKQLQAYTRTIAIADVPRSGMAEALTALLADRGPGALGRRRREALAVQDHLLRRILEEADARGLPYQFHTGMTTLADSSPALLEPTIRRYRHVKFVLLHAYPFISEAAYLARVYPNVWIDTSWQALQSPGVLRKALAETIGMAPASRITASIDATCLEEFAGGLAITRDVLAEVLAEKCERGDLSLAQALDAVDRILGRNALELYQL